MSRLHCLSKLQQFRCHFRLLYRFIPSWLLNPLSILFNSIKYYVTGSMSYFRASPNEFIPFVNRSVCTCEQQCCRRRQITNRQKFLTLSDYQAWSELKKGHRQYNVNNFWRFVIRSTWLVILWECIRTEFMSVQFILTSRDVWSLYTLKCRL